MPVISTWRGVVAYVALVLGATWTIEIAALASGMRFGGASAGPIALMAGMMFLPALSAYVVRRYVTREGFATAGLRLGPRRYYVAIWAGVPMLFVAIAALTVGLGFGHLDLTGREALAQLRALVPVGRLPSARRMEISVLIITLTWGLAVNMVATFGEEFGWTGYLFPTLVPLVGRWRAAGMYGIVWGLWHAPLIWGGFNYPGHRWLGIPMMCAFTVAVGCIQAALRLRTGSVFVTSFLHAVVNAQTRGIWMLVLLGVAPLLGGTPGAISIVVFGAVGVALLATTPPSPLERGTPTTRSGSSGRRVLHEADLDG